MTEVVEKAEHQLPDSTVDLEFMLKELTKEYQRLERRSREVASTAAGVADNAEAAARMPEVNQRRIAVAKKLLAMEESHRARQVLEGHKSMKRSHELYGELMPEYQAFAQKFDAAIQELGGEFAELTDKAQQLQRSSAKCEYKLRKSPISAGHVLSPRALEENATAAFAKAFNIRQLPLVDYFRWGTVTERFEKAQAATQVLGE